MRGDYVWRLEQLLVQRLRDRALVDREIRIVEGRLRILQRATSDFDSVQRPFNPPDSEGEAE